MTPETQEILAKARRTLLKARFDADHEFYEDAARGAYLAAFHAARAIIFERTGKMAKTHKGVHGGFSRLAKEELGIPRELLSFLGRSYDFKVVADYETGLDATVTAAEASDVVASAERFLACVEAVMEAPNPDPE